NHLFTSDGSTLDPLRFRNEEIHIKYGRSAWLATASLFNQVKSNVGAAITTSRGMCPPGPTSFCYFQQGDSQRIKGMEFGFDGEILPGFSASANYSFYSTQTIAGTTDSARQILTQAPTRSAGLTLDWTPWFARRTNLNLVTQYQSKVWQAG